jgi:hypothetical protein
MPAEPLPPRLLVIAPDREDAHRYVLTHYPDREDLWVWVESVWQLSGRSRDRYEAVVLPGAEGLETWPLIAASLVVLRLTVLPTREVQRV